MQYLGKKKVYQVDLCPSNIGISGVESIAPVLRGKNELITKPERSLFKNYFVLDNHLFTLLASVAK